MDLLFRLRTDAKTPVPTFVHELADGSWIATMQGKSNAKPKAADPFTVRVIDYRLDTDPADTADTADTADSVDSDEQSDPVCRLMG
ncbi:hypothetical protein [Corynebacterium variabile]|uniref:Uncharacterized protein n=1 Tax=Corynebacterium variabile TaxID=1727 RepID=A0A4Y4C4C2_9CORY|nr:hypothetical protein [Corynebacterium variabile]GEC85977.1 hypothetical protein CVA01_12910 [Corynebacterium variabile]